MVTIRLAQEHDLAVLHGLIETLGFHKQEGYFERCLQEQKAGKRQIFIAGTGDDQSGDLGYGMLNWRPRYALFKRLGIPEIQDLNVIHAARRRGVASALIGHCEALAREQGCEHIGIGVGLHAGYGPAQRLYVKLGYMPDGAGAVYDRQAVEHGEIRPVDDDLCLMMVKAL